MNLIPSKVGADRKRLTILGALVVVLVTVFFLNRDSSPSSAAPSKPALSATAPESAASRPIPPERRSMREQQRRVEDFRPSLKPPEGIDISRIDPALKLDLLAKLQNVPMEAGSRGSVFAFGQAPAPPPPKIKINPGAMPVANKQLSALPAAPSKPPSAPAPPPIPLKFFGYANSPHGQPKRAFFLDGDDIQVAGENDVIRNRYKIIRIGMNSVVVEDTANKSQQTLKLVEELAG